MTKVSRRDGRVRAHLGFLESVENTAAQFECVVDDLHARRVFGKVIVAKVGLLRAHSDDKAVVFTDYPSTGRFAAVPV
jgi:hypothetical protein